MRRSGRPVESPHPMPGRRHLRWTLLALAVTAGMAALVTPITGPLHSGNAPSLSNHHLPAASDTRQPPTVAGRPRPTTASGNPTTAIGGPPMAGPSELVTEVHAVTVVGIRRTYRSIAPVQAPDRVPLLIVLHGRGQSYSATVRQTGFVGLAQRRQAVLVFPDGQRRSWNAGQGCCGFAGSRRAPDLPFVAMVVADAMHRWPVDMQRVYLVGYSNGGKLAYSAVCAHPRLFAAVATYGAVPLSPCGPGTPAVPFLLATGALDRVLPFHGRPGGHPPLPAVPQAVDWLRTQDGCPSRAPTGWDSSAVVQRWANCASRADVELVVYPQWGHAWPGATAGVRSPAVASLIWAFLSRHDQRTTRLPPATKVLTRSGGPHSPS